MVKMVDPVMVLGFIRLAAFAIKTIEAAQKGDLDDFELARRWATVRRRLEDANLAWEASGSPPGDPPAS